VQRKVFRIEQMVGGGAPAAAPDDSAQPADVAEELRQPAEPAQELTRELAAIQSAILRNMRELSVLINDGNDRRMARAAGELGAAVESMESATQKILASAEAVDDCARALASALNDDYHHGLAQDVQDHVVRIYEACNFQDLAGQRIGKVIAMLMMVEERLVAMIQRHSGVGVVQQVQASKPAQSTKLINGPRLDGASGHASQLDIDAMFA
jgi:chemotaxis protein CheZ